MGDARPDTDVVDGLCPDQECMIVRELLVDAAIGESVSAGYARTQFTCLAVERRIKRDVDKEMVGAVAAVVRACAERAHVVVVVRVDQREACVCTVHGMRWEGEGAPPKVVMKLVDVPVGEPCEQSRRTPGPAPCAHGKSRGTEDAVERAQVLLVAWVLFGWGVYLSFTVMLLASRLAWKVY
jgi:hypothetical protein